jgi:fatty acid desaturase
MIPMSNLQDFRYHPVGLTKLSIPRATNFALAAGQIFVNILQLFILPLYCLPKSMWWSLVLIPIAAMNNPFWSLIHEAIHELLDSSRRVNLAVGRLLAVFFGSPFHILRLTHLSHHKFNRSPLERGTEMYNPNEVSKLQAACGYFFYILCGLYLLEVSSTLLFFLPPRVFSRMTRHVSERGNTQEKWLANKFKDEQVLRQTRIDGVAIGLIFGFSAYCYREHESLFLGLLMIRTFLISFMDNVYHYSTPLHATVSGHNLWLPRIFSTLLLNFNFHRVHHHNPNIPWMRLPGTFGRQSERFDNNLISAAFHQLCGPISLYELEKAAVKIRKQ